MDSRNPNDFRTACRKRLRQCVLRHGIAMGGLITMFAVTGHFLKGFDAKHLIAELLIVYLAISFHLCAERLLRRYERLSAQLRAARKADPQNGSPLS